MPSGTTDRQTEENAQNDWAALPAMIIPHIRYRPFSSCRAHLLPRSSRNLSRPENLIGFRIIKAVICRSDWSTAIESLSLTNQSGTLLVVEPSHELWG